MPNIRRRARVVTAAVFFGVVACRPDAPTGAPLTSVTTTSRGSVDGLGTFDVPIDCRDCVVGPMTFVREEGAPQSQTVTFVASPARTYIVDLDDLGSKGAGASVSVNGLELLGNRGTGPASAQHVQRTIRLEEQNTLVVRLVGKPGSSLRVAIWRYRPVSIDGLTLDPGLIFEIAGPVTSLNATITNHTDDAIANVRVDAMMQQMSASRVVSDAPVACGVVGGLLPPGRCANQSQLVAIKNSSAGVGTLTAGAASLIVRVRDGAEVLDSIVLPVTLNGPAVASVNVSPSTATLRIGEWLDFTATIRDAEENVLTGRGVTWTSDKPQIATVASSGRVTGVSGGTATIYARSEGKIGTATVTVTSVIATGISDIRLFLERCPTGDDVYSKIRQEFEIRVDGQLVSAPLDCTEPYSAMPIDQLTDELIAVQVVRTAYYMARGTQGRLPWTTKDLYAWMTSNVSGVNLKTAPGQLYCCDLINGKLYLSTSRQDAFQRDFKRTWPGIASSLNYYAHEIRHADPGAPGHTTGCAAFPLPTDPAGCDATYDLSNLGSYGVQYWLESNWATGYLNIGIGCSPPATAQEYVMWHLGSVNQFRSRFVANVPPGVAVTPPYGGPCFAP